MFKVLVTAAIVTGVIFLVSGAEAACPVGSYPWVDEWGNHICKRFGSGGTSTIEGSSGRCPTGSYPWRDSWGGIESVAVSTTATIATTRRGGAPQDSTRGLIRGGIAHARHSEVPHQRKVLAAAVD